MSSAAAATLRALGAVGAVATLALTAHTIRPLLVRARYNDRLPATVIHFDNKDISGRPSLVGFTTIATVSGPRFAQNRRLRRSSRQSAVLSL